MKFERKGRKRKTSKVMQIVRERKERLTYEKEEKKTHCRHAVEDEMYKVNTLLRSYLAPTTPPSSAFIGRLYCVYQLHREKKD